MSTPIVVRGARVDPAPSRPDGAAPSSDFQKVYGDALGYRVVDRVVTAAGRGTAAAVTLDAADDDILELEDVDQIVTFHRASSLQTATETAAARQAARQLPLSDGAARIPLDVVQDVARGQNQGRIAEVRRSTLSLPAEIVADLEVLNRSLPDQLLSGVAGLLFEPVARAAMRRIAAWIDAPVADDAPDAVRRKRPKTPGLYRVGADLRLEPPQLLSEPPPGSPDDPYLLLVHGTFSHTEGAFAALRGTDEWSQLARRYDERMLALEHPTLSLTPAENVRAVAELLPEGTPLHVVTHSRGGLVGDVLSLAATGTKPIDLSPYTSVGFEVGDHPDLTALPQLRELLQDRHVRVTRFARVASPARGTTLASRRLDRYATYLFNALRLIPGPMPPGMIELVQKFLLTMLDQRSDPRIVPGLEAQMPESPLIRLLNTAPPIDDGLGNLTGDIEGSGIARRLLVFGADLFYRADNDLVVNTGSMTGGVPRVHGRTRFFQGSKVNHNAYFANEDSRAALRDWLQGGDRDVPGFVDGGLAETTSRTIRGAALSRVAPSDDRWPKGKADNGIVVVIPDLFGSRFEVGGRAAWPDDLGAISRGGVDWLLAAPSDGSEATDLLFPYHPLINSLREQYAVKPFPYDPRLPLAAAVKELRDLVPQLMNKGRRKVHLVAHGYGCLVALGLRDGAPTQWKTMSKGGNRTVLMSPPLLGTWTAPRRAEGQDELCGAMSLLHRADSPEAVGRVFGGLPAYRDLAPSGDPKAVAAQLRKRQEEDWTGICAVFGHAAQTPRRPDDAHQGDGYVTYEAGAVRGLPTWYAAVPFADLANDPNTIEDVGRLLVDAAPTRLIGAPPPAGRPLGSAESAPQTPVLPLFPDAAELTRLGLGAATPVEVPHEELHLSVVHGDVAASKGSVIIGTYDGTPIGGSEAALDLRLNGALSRHRVLGQYPGPPGSCQLFTHDSGRALSAAVIGLGDPGDLTAGRLTTGITQAALRLAARELDIATTRVAQGETPERIRVSLETVLIGTTGAAAMPISVAVPAIVAGVRRANRRLADQHQVVQQLDVVIDAVCFIELYEERAADAVQAAIDLASTSAGADAPLVVESAVRDGQNGLPGNLRITDSSNMWRTIRVAAAPGAKDRPDDALVELAFTSVGRSAGAQQRVTAGQREIIESLIARCVNEPTVDRQLYNTLYELVVPNSLKAQGRESEHLMFVLDDEAARLPFEMLATRSRDEDDEPLAVSVGLVRRLESREFRDGVRLATGSRALVIGDPPTHRFQRLPGAIAEANAVADTLAAAGYEVTRLIPADTDDDTSVDPIKIMNALFEHDYRIVHIAAHGDFNPQDRARSGVIIGDRAYLTAMEIQQMQTAPDLFFLNCCHLGSMTPVGGAGAAGGAAPSGSGSESPSGWRPDRLAASISRELINSGARAVIAAGWAVDDEKATEFATTFYRSMLGGSDLGTSALIARQAIYPRGNDRKVNTWGAYQVYGPPALQLATTGRDGAPDREPRSRGEFLRLLERFAERADHAEGQAADDLRTRLAEREAKAPPAWMDGLAFQAIGTAYRNLGDHAEASRTYERALESWGSGASVRTVDRLIGSLTSWGVELAQDPAREHEAKEHFQRAEDLLHGLDCLIGQQPPDRISLRGGYYRRRLLVGADLDASLEAAFDAYRRSSQAHRERSGTAEPFTTLRAVALGWVRSLRLGVKAPSNARELVHQAIKQAKSQEYPDEWVRLAQVDGELMLGLLDGGRSTTPAAIVRAYASEFDSGASMRARRSVTENLEIMLRCLPRGEDDQVEPRAEPAERLLTAVRSALERWEPRSTGFSRVEDDPIG